MLHYKRNNVNVDIGTYVDIIYNYRLTSTFPMVINRNVGSCSLVNIRTLSHYMCIDVNPPICYRNVVGLSSLCIHCQQMRTVNSLRQRIYVSPPVRSWHIPPVFEDAVSYSFCTLHKYAILQYIPRFNVWDIFPHFVRKYLSNMFQI